MGHKIVQLVSTIREGSRLALTIDQKILRKAGWKPGPAKAISHGIAGGNVAGTLIRGDNGIEPDGSQIFKSNGNAPSKQNQARNRFKRNGGSSRKFRVHSCRCNRYSNSRSNYKR